MAYFFRATNGELDNEYSIMCGDIIAGKGMYAVINITTNGETARQWFDNPDNKQVIDDAIANGIEDDRIKDKIRLIEFKLRANAMNTRCAAIMNSGSMTNAEALQAIKDLAEYTLVQNRAFRYIYSKVQDISNDNFLT